ncbi:MAG: hypothetical protein ACJA2S_003256 [Cyclobacteriaceae bacterium]|jgi:hypothetical protein
MDRRKALKSISLSTGFVVSSSTFFSLLQSCTEKDKIEWIPQFFNKEEAIVISEISNIILPPDDLPGALDVDVPRFIDLLMKDVFDKDFTDKFMKGLKIFTSRFEIEYGSEFHESSQEEQQELVNKAFSASETETKNILTLISKKEAPADKKEKYYLYSFLVTLRDLTIKSYFTSEKIGEEVLSYDPIPGRQEGCVPVEDIGNVWAF